MRYSKACFWRVPNYDDHCMYRQYIAMTLSCVLKSGLGERGGMDVCVGGEVGMGRRVRERGAWGRNFLMGGRTCFIGSTEQCSR